MQSIDPRAEGLLAWWQPRMRAVLGEAYRGSLLYGSVVTGDFAAGWSDVDVCVVIDGHVADAERRAWHALEQEAHARFVDGGEEDWRSGQTLDAIVVQATALADGAAPEPAPFDRLSLAEHGRVFDGEAPPVAPPPRAALVGHLRAGLEELAQPLEVRSAIWIADRIAILARSLAYACDGRLLSKSAALACARDFAPVDQAALDLALAVRRAGSASAPKNDASLRAAFVRIQEPVTSVLTDALAAS